MKLSTRDREILLPWLESEPYAKAKSARLMVERLAIIAGLDYKTDELCRRMRDYEARVLIFTSYPLGKGRAFRVDPVGACR